MTWFSPQAGHGQLPYLGHPQLLFPVRRRTSLTRVASLQVSPPLLSACPHLLLTGSQGQVDRPPSCSEACTAPSPSPPGLLSCCALSASPDVRPAVHLPAPSPQPAQRQTGSPWRAGVSLYLSTVPGTEQAPPVFAKGTSRLILLFVLVVNREPGRGVCLCKPVLLCLPHPHRTW